MKKTREQKAPTTESLQFKPMGGNAPHNHRRIEDDK